jgi:hypothetical protein
MQIGVRRPNHRGIDEVDAVVAIGSLAEEMQFDSVWASDHLLNDSYISRCGCRSSLTRTSNRGVAPNDVIRADNIGVAADRLKRYQEVGVSHVIFLVRDRQPRSNS